MNPPIEYFKSITFKDKIINLEPNSVVVFVGPNNVGKTTALRELQNYVGTKELSYNDSVNTVVRSVDFYSPSDPEDKQLEAWLDNFIDPIIPPGTDREARIFRNWGASFNARPTVVKESIVSRDNSHGEASLLISTGENAALEGQAPDYYSVSSMGGGNLQYEQLYNDSELEERLKRLSLEVFSVPVAISRFGGKSFLHYGNLPENISSPPTAMQQEALRAVPKVSGQGAGVSTLLKLGISMLIGHEPLVFLDEPDVHLHPPQARKAGRFVADRSDRSQIFITTHSVDFLLGLLDSRKPVTVIRLDRVGQVTSASELGGNLLLEAWKDPIIKYSRSLSGLMHKGVVICESEVDCLYFQAALDGILQEEGGASHDLLFIPSGGKAGIKKIIPTLKSLSVPILVVADFDFLRFWEDIDSLSRALGYNPEPLKNDWTLLNGYLASRKDARTVDGFKVEIEKVLSSFDSDMPYSRDHMEKLRAVIKTNDGWSNAKKEGLESLPAKQAAITRSLLRQLKAFGIMVIPFGELESFDTGSSKHGAAWLAHVMDSGSYATLPTLKRRFVKGIWELLARF